jgi:hypothetical protein
VISWCQAFAFKWVKLVPATPRQDLLTLEERVARIERILNAHNMVGTPYNLNPV